MRDVISILFEDFETLDLFGPVEILGRLHKQFSLKFYSHKGSLVKSSQGAPVMTGTISDISTKNYILLIPGGIGTRPLVKDDIFISILRTLAGDAEYILTVCTGSTLFSKTGLLNGRKATSNKKAFTWTLEESPAVNWTKKARWVKDGNIFTSSGVSAGMDMTLGFVAEVLDYKTAKLLNTEIEYDWKEDPSWDPFAEIDA